MNLLWYLTQETKGRNGNPRSCMQMRHMHVQDAWHKLAAMPLTMPPFFTDYLFWRKTQTFLRKMVYENY